MPDRENLRAAFLREIGAHPEGAVPLAADASFRRYFRTPNGVLMDAPPPEESVRPFVRIARHLARIGLSAPTVLHADEARGFLLLEDLGDDLFSRRLDAGRDPRPLYTAAVDVLVHLARHPAPPGLPPYDFDALMEEADLFLDWFLPGAGISLPSNARKTWQETWKEVLDPVRADPAVLVLRDCHADNLLWLPGRRRPRNVGLLDFQDALSGHPAYDLASLLDDVRTRAPDPHAGELTRRYLRATRFDPPSFRRSLAILSAQRSTKILGIFTRLAVRDHKPHYRSWIPSTWRRLEARLAEPCLAPVQAWFERHVPASVRAS